MRKIMLAAFAAVLLVAGAAFAATDLNTATAEQLQTLRGVGPARAQAIIAYREQHGPFKSLDDLNKVPGFGEKTVAALASELTINGAPAQASASASAKTQAGAPAAPAASANAQVKAQPQLNRAAPSATTPAAQPTSPATPAEKMQRSTTTPAAQPGSPAATAPAKSNNPSASESAPAQPQSGSSNY